MSDDFQPDLGVDMACDSNPNLADPISSKVSIVDVLSLLRALLTLKLLRTTSSVFRVNRDHGNSDAVKSSSIHQAIERRKQRIINIIISMARKEVEGDRCDCPHRSGLSPSVTIPKTVPTQTVANEDSESLLVQIPSDMSTRSLPAEQAGAMRTVILVPNENRRSMNGGISQKGGRRSGVYSSLPPPISDSIYSSTLRRSLSVSNVHSVSSGPRQCMVVSAAQYTRIVSERQPQFSIVSQPWSIDSLVAEEARFDRSALELDGLRQTRSAESFPGSFPVSEGLEYSSLATAASHLRVPSVRTSVRPFSDL